MSHGPFAVVLAAGASRRMGRPKALLRLDGDTVVAHHVRRLAVVCAPVVVVLGADAEAIQSALPEGTRGVHNPQWSTTHPSDSLRCALASDLGEVGFVAPVDTPPAHPDTLRRLLAAGAPAVPIDVDGQAGHPVLIGPRVQAALREGTVPGGLRTLLTHATRVSVDDPRVAVDFDDPRAFVRFRESWSG